MAPDFGQRGFEGLAILGAERLDGPVLLRLERADFPLPLDDQPKRDGLDPSGRETGLDAVPENGTGLVTHQTIENAAGLLRIHLAIVDLTRIPERLLNGLLGDLVEQDAVSTNGSGQALPDLFRHMPGDGLSLAVRVGGQVNSRRGLGRLLQLGQSLCLAFDGDVLGLESVLHVNAELPGWQISQVPDGGLYVIARAEVLTDGLGLGGRLDDNERRTAVPSNPRAVVLGATRLGGSRGRSWGGSLG